MNPNENYGVNSGIDLTLFLITRMAKDTGIVFETARCLITQARTNVRLSRLGKSASTDVLRQFPPDFMHPC